MVPLLGFSPDMDPATPGIMTACTDFIPTEKGFATAPSRATAVYGLAALASECRGAAVLVDTTGARRNFAGTQTKLYELTSATWTDRSRGGNYTGSSENRWMFAQFGNVALATNDTEPIQYSASGAFADIATAPKARIILSAKDFVIALNTNDGTYGDQSDRWWCSAFQDYSSWTPSLSTQATTGRLVGVSGEITAGAMLGSYAVAYKELGIFVGQYVGSPVVWQWDQVPGEAGCVGPEAIADIGGAHLFVGPDNIWLFDGTRPVPIANGILRQWFFNNISQTFRYRTIVSFDRQNQRVWIFFPGVGSTTGKPDQAIVYHLLTKRFGVANQSVEAVFQFSAPGLTWDTFSSAGASWDALPSIPWDSQSWQSAGRSLAVFNISHELFTLTGASAGGGFTTWDIGDDEQVTYADPLRIRFASSPSAGAYCFAYGGTRMTSGGQATYSGASVNMSDGKLDIRQSGRWHTYAIRFVGSFEVSGLVPKFRAAGSR